MNIENYEKFLNVLMMDLETIFTDQREYICCKEGCAFCCKKGEYPFSKLEFDYLMLGYSELSIKRQNEIKAKIDFIKKIGDKEYSCPFLFDDVCSVYKYRGLTCRTFGLLTERADKTLTIPFCTNLGLNYSNVYDKNSRQILTELYKENNYYIPPTAFKLNYRNIMSLPLAKELNLEFGEVKRLIDWF